MLSSSPPVNTIPDVQPAPSEVETLEQCARSCRAIEAQLGRAIVGQHETVQALMVALLARGHVLLVGVPGLAKTLTVSCLARVLGLSFGRVQFTPDLLPADITGSDVLHEADGAGGRGRELRFASGPIFKNLVLADEVNRTPPKTQAALLQAMQEREVTVGGATHPLPDPFHVFATRNPIEQEGTYPLPEAQLDRFLLEVHVEYPSESEEKEIARTTAGREPPELSRVVGLEELRRFGALVPRIPITHEAVELAVRLARASRPRDSAVESVRRYVRFGAGPRGSQSLVLAAKARAAMEGLMAAEPAQVLAVALPALRHRLVLSYRAEADGVLDADIVREIKEAMK